MARLDIDLSSVAGIPNPDFLGFEKRLATIQKEIHSVIPPLPHQLPVLNAFFRDWVDGFFLRCGRKFSKTHIVVYCPWVFALLFAGSENYIIYDEKDHGKDIIWKNGRLPRFLSSVKKMPGETVDAWRARKRRGMLIEEKYIASISNSELTIKFRNGSTITVEGSKNVGRADGLQPTFIAYDEFKNHDPAFDEAMRPNLDVFDGRILVAGTPPKLGEGEHYLKLEEEFKRAPGKRHVCLPSYNNLLIYPGGRTGVKFKALENEYRARGEYHVFAREYLGMDVPDQSTAVFPHLDRDKHMHLHENLMMEYRETQGQWDHFLVFDPGSTTCFAALFAIIHEEDKRFWILDELYETNQAKTTVGHIWPAAREKLGYINCDMDDWLIGYDSAAVWFANEVSAVYDVGMLPCDKKMRKGEGKQDQLGVIRSAMVTGRFAMSDRCQNTFREMRAYATLPLGKLPKENDHTIDCMRYITRFATYDTLFQVRDIVDPFPRMKHRLIRVEDDDAVA